MTPQDKYTKIMKVMSDKTIETNKILELKKIVSGSYACSRVWEAWQYGTMTIDDFSPLEEDENFITDCMEIIGHPLHIGDVLDWIEKIPEIEYEVEMSMKDKLQELWKDKRNSLGTTNEELVDYIYNLLP